MLFRKSDKPPEIRPQTDDSLEELRKLLLGPMQERFDKMQQLLNMLENQELQAEEVSSILPEAIMMRSSRDSQIVTAMEPVTERAIEASIKRDPRTLVSMLVPVMLPAIRKAITTLIKEMIQTFSATLEHGLSLRGLRWRYEAFKSKKPFGEVALLHSLVYQVEQVFLIHRETGLVLQSDVSKDTVVVQDADMVSGMLTAIQDFVRDSFGATQDDSLENLQFGDRSIWIEQSQFLVLAAVVWGNAPVELRKILRDAVHAIHFENLDNLRHFDGDTSKFESAKIHLSACLKSQPKQIERNPFVLWSLAGIIVFVIGYASFFAIRDHIRWTNYLEKLQKEPGIIVAETDKRKGQYYLFGLRDSMAADPVKLLNESHIETDKVVFKWELFHSSHPEFMVRRISKILNPPESVKLTYKDGVLIAEGEAPHKWIADSKKLVEAVPGLTRYDHHKLIDRDAKNMDILRENIENTLFFFDTVSVRMKPGQENLVEKLANDIKELMKSSQVFDKQIKIEITGHTDSVGTEERNTAISQKRAEELMAQFVAKGLKPEMFTLRAAASKEPVKEERTEQDREMNRSVTFKVSIMTKENKPK